MPLAKWLELFHLRYVGRDEAASPAADLTVVIGADFTARAG